MSVQNSQRLHAIDALRGFVMLIMMVDHVRETFFLHQQVPDPMVVSETEPSLFVSRLLAHLCAPVFVLLTGLSAYLYQNKNNNLKMTREFLFKRGFFLIFLELIVVNFAWTGQFPPQVVYLQVIWAIGLSMIALALLIGLPKMWQWILALTIVFGHNLLDGIHFDSALWNVLHDRGWIQVNDHFKMRTSYPVLPWIGVILLGYCLGSAWFKEGVSVAQRNRKILYTALGAIGLFFVLRFINIYGDHAWQVMPTTLQTVMSFFNLTKYPPSLFFILWNGGIGLLLLLLLQRFEFKPLVIFGSVPMFYYILHLYVLKAMYLIAVQLFGLNHGAYFGVDHVYSVWLIAIFLCLALYPAVAWFSKYKHQNKHIKMLKYF